MQIGVAAVLRIKLAKAREFLEMAEFASDQHPNTAVSLAVSAAVNASDALCLVANGSFPTGEDHGEAAKVLRKAGLQVAGKHLTRVLTVKYKGSILGLNVQRTRG